MNKKTYQVTVQEDGDDVPAAEVVSNIQHCVKAQTNKNSGDVYLTFSSRIAMHEFGRVLLHAAKFNTNDSMELFPLAVEGGDPMMVDGVRLTLDSSRVFLFFPALNKT